MKTLKVLLIAVFLISVHPYIANAIELVTDKAHSKIGFSVSHFFFSTTDGHFTDFKGTIDLDEQDLTQSKVAFTVRVNSIDTANLKRDKHLRSPDFFDVNKLPDARFVSTGIEKVTGGGYRLEGDLTIHGITKKVAFSLDYVGETKGQHGIVDAHFKARTVLDRRDFGITYDPTGFGIGKKVTLTVDAFMVPEVSTPSPNGASGK